MALKKRVVECLEKRQQAENQKAPVKNALDTELEGFTLMITSYLKKLTIIPRLKAQQDMLHIVSEALQNEEEYQNFE